MFHPQFASATSLTEQQFQQILQFQQNFNVQQQMMIAASLPLSHTGRIDETSYNEPANANNDDYYKLFVANLDERVDEELLYELFIHAGPIEEVHLPREKSTNRHRKFAFIKYKHRCTPPYAMHLYKDTALFGKTLIIKYLNSPDMPPLPPLQINGVTVNAKNEVQTDAHSEVMGYQSHINPFSIDSTASNWQGNNNSRNNRHDDGTRRRHHYDNNDSRRSNTNNASQRRRHAGSNSRSEQRKRRRS